MIKYQYKFVYKDEFLTMYRRCTILGIIPINSWTTKTSPFNSVSSLVNICERKGIKKIFIETI